MEAEIVQRLRTVAEGFLCGSVLYEDFRLDSNVDLLVSRAPGVV